MSSFSCFPYRWYIQQQQRNYYKLLDENNRLKEEFLKLQKRLDDAVINRTDANISISNNSLVVLPHNNRRYLKEKDGKYHINEICYDKLNGSRDDVWRGVAFKTTGELTKKDLVIGKGDKVVKKKSDTGELGSRLRRKRPRICEEE